MQLIDSLLLSDGSENRTISLYQGDLSRIPPQHKVDMLVVSAFPDDYSPTHSSLIGALDQSGLSVAVLAQDKAHDLRSSSGFWLSAPLGAEHAELNIARILCFEPEHLGQPPQVVGELFRGLFPFLDDDNDAVIAMPLISSGDQGWPPEAMFRPLIEAAYKWLSRGMAIRELMIVEKDPQRAEKLRVEFAAFKSDLPARPASQSKPMAPSGKHKLLEILGTQFKNVFARPRVLNGAVSLPAAKPAADSAKRYDVFLSYSSKDDTAAKAVSDALKSRHAGVRIFDFKLEIDVGKSYQDEIDDAIEGCSRVVAIMSPDYFASPECKEELYIARLRNKRSDGTVLFPLYWRDLGRELRMWIQIINYADCRESDDGKLQGAVRTLKGLLAR